MERNKGIKIPETIHANLKCLSVKTGLSNSKLIANALREWGTKRDLKDANYYEKNPEAAEDLIAKLPSWKQFQRTNHQSPFSKEPKICVVYPVEASIFVQVLTWQARRSKSDIIEEALVELFIDNFGTVMTKSEAYREQFTERQVQNRSYQESIAYKESKKAIKDQPPTEEEEINEIDKSEADQLEEDSWNISLVKGQLHHAGIIKNNDPRPFDWMRQQWLALKLKSPEVLEQNQPQDVPEDEETKKIVAKYLNE